ncbi:hypothetical protein AK812_SmicGene35455 [Symbiodinium microadriaticum]|uniref:Uncharacterized protein n=2 Tax=Symbiodinium TaxID=2949 RepID=A0A1Q9CLK4_SYMMI|nr:hypothetical protein AK812_SmicGene35455 [Symbiodinium microadriaticum]
MLRRIARSPPGRCLRAARGFSRREMSSLPRGMPGKGPEEEEDIGNCPMFAPRQAPSAAEAPAPKSRMLRLFRMVPKDVVQSIHSSYWLLVGGPLPRHLVERGMGYEFNLQVIFIRLAFRMVVFGIGATILALTGRRLWHRYRAPPEETASSPTA